MKWFHWLFHDWSYWSEPHDSNFTFKDTGKTFVAAFQERKCKICNKQEIRRLW